MYENCETKCDYSEKEPSAESIFNCVGEIIAAIYGLEECLNHVSLRMFEDNNGIEVEHPDCNNTLDARLGLIRCELLRCLKVASFIDSRLG